MAGEAARRFGKRPRVFVFSDNDYRGERWEIVRRSVRGLRNIKLAWAARDVEESARDARNVDARALRARGIGEVVFPSVKMSEEWYAKASRERLSLVPWIVDTREDVVRAVRLGVMGVITNTPLKTQKMLNEICARRRLVKIDLIVLYCCNTKLCARRRTTLTHQCRIRHRDVQRRDADLRFTRRAACPRRGRPKPSRTSSPFRGATPS